MYNLWNNSNSEWHIPGLISPAEGKEMLPHFKESGGRWETDHTRIELLLSKDAGRGWKIIQTRQILVARMAEKLITKRQAGEDISDQSYVINIIHKLIYWLVSFISASSTNEIKYSWMRYVMYLEFTQRNVQTQNKQIQLFSLDGERKKDKFCYTGTKQQW